MNHDHAPVIVSLLSNRPQTPAPPRPPLWSGPRSTNINAHKPHTNWYNCGKGRAIELGAIGAFVGGGAGLLKGVDYLATVADPNVMLPSQGFLIAIGSPALGGLVGGAGLYGAATFGPPAVCAVIAQVSRARAIVANIVGNSLERLQSDKTSENQAIAEADLELGTV